MNHYENVINEFNKRNCKLLTTFFIIPEKVLIDRKLIGDKTKKGRITFSFTLEGELYKKSWLNDYIFSYDKIAKKKLLKMFIERKFIDFEILPPNVPYQVF
jgi:hypothetical protein